MMDKLCAGIQDSEIQDCALLSTHDEPSCIAGGSLVHGCLIQPGVQINRHAIVKDSFLFEWSCIDQEAKVSHPFSIVPILPCIGLTKVSCFCLLVKVHQSIVCPDSAISTGECHHSLVGPFLGFHHQSLLIAALWPKGRGKK